MHGVLHLGWVPVRHLIVYPALLRRIEREWREGAG
jgi:hypothetical protein